MRSIAIDKLKAGMRYSKPVYIDGDSLFVPEGIPIKQKDLDRLKKWGMTEVLTDGELEGDESAKGENKNGVLGFTGGELESVKNQYRKIEKRYSEVFAAVKNNQKVDPQEIDGIVDTLYKLLQRYKNDLIQFVLYGAGGKSDLIENSLNCAILATVVGTNLNMIQHKLLELTTGALLHDLGMLRLPEEITKKTGKLEIDELQKIKTHPIHSYRIISKEMKYPEEIGFIGLQHHERWDGIGYPKKLAGKKIILNARIVSVVDAFVAIGQQTALP
jgi:HD-GYP domain-containing protein (c-di-GMP phosphodiesterase class II)